MYDNSVNLSIGTKVSVFLLRLTRNAPDRIVFVKRLRAKDFKAFENIMIANQRSSKSILIKWRQIKGAKLKYNNLSNFGLIFGFFFLVRSPSRSNQCPRNMLICKTAYKMNCLWVMLKILANQAILNKTRGTYTMVVYMHNVFTFKRAWNFQQFLIVHWN